MKTYIKRDGNIPQIWIVIAIYLGYAGPVLLKYFYDVTGGGVEIFSLKDTSAFITYSTIWLMAIIPFFFGFGLAPKKIEYQLPRDINKTLTITIGLLAPIYVLVKALLARDGVYQNYAFDSDLMVGGVWSFSMFLSETFVLLFAFSLLAKNRKLAVICFLLISINVLHGTRIFNFVSILIFAAWYITNQKFTKTVLLKMLLSFAGLMVCAMIVFLYRSDVDFLSVSFEEQLFYLFSPVVYESVFSQTSLLDLANSAFGDSTCDAIDFFWDFSSFVIPRILNEGKDAICLARYSYMQPLGAFNGIFASYIYFGWWYFLYFFGYGLFLRGLRAAKSGKYFFNVIYFYCLANISIRIVRDGPILAGKYLANALVIVLLIFLLDKALPYFRFSRSALSN
ncbi:hypothetical protein HH212_13395 [Massilia forsythiae]|uniref:Oligosaccharide repeat unit polymerase n=1 Tax=Massilia forsythiae TaxID=2728020 RepID=A0A7Z2VWQ5_9BURK|nr:hypothetical protein [Massilia forsythiae]QJE00893.1 hypothetical protein HH212_13395 [Massilia forsythiae]